MPFKNYLLLCALAMPVALSAAISKPGYSEFAAQKQLAETGDAAAQYDLALMYDNGDGITENNAEAVVWYTKAAEQGLSKAQHNLAVMHYSGEGTPVDFSKALLWFRKAAE